MVQCLRLCTSTAGGMGSIPGQATKIVHALRFSQKKKKKLPFSSSSPVLQTDANVVVQ